MKEQQVSRALGWFSIGLGLAELLAPRWLGKAIGLNNHTTLLRVFGVREIMSGVAILSQPRSATWVRTRVAGDVLDLAVLGAALRSNGSDKSRIALATAAVAGVTIADVLCSQQLARKYPHEKAGKGVRIKKSITINRSPEELYRFWRDFENLPRVMNHLESVRVQDDRHSHWIAKAPLGHTVEWDAEIVRDEPNKLIAWRSLKGADVENWGTVSFAPATRGRETVVRVELEYHPPGGVIGAKLAKLFGKAPEQQVSSDLRPFKQLMETGEIARTSGQPAARPTSTSRRYDQTVKDLAATSATA
ncbi:MAG TPA: SRPBCC family protein [Verrucomicrobiae bacterium]|jgi:uncharacterized membrane protein